MSKYKIGDAVWVAYVSGDFTDSLKVDTTTILGVYREHDRWYYGTKLDTRYGSPRYCDIPEEHVFTTKDEALDHLREVRLYKLESDARTFQSLADKAKANAAAQKVEIERWRNESHS